MNEEANESVLLKSLIEFCTICLGFMLLLYFLDNFFAPDHKSWIARGGDLLFDIALVLLCLAAFAATLVFFWLIIPQRYVSNRNNRERENHAMSNSCSPEAVESCTFFRGNDIRQTEPRASASGSSGLFATAGSGPTSDDSRSSSTRSTTKPYNYK